MAEMERNAPQKLAHAGGRPKGRRNKKSIGAILAIGEFFTNAIEVAGWNRLLNSADDGVFFQAFKLAVQYKRGLPAQQIVHSGEIAHMLSDAERQEAQETIRKLLSGSKVIDVEEAKDVGDVKDVKNVVN
jgi:hypothetical protein